MTKQDIINEINLIAAKSYTTAETVREVLNAMLDFSDDGININAATINEVQASLDGLNTIVGQHADQINTNTSDISNLGAKVENHESRIRILENEEDTGGYLDFHILDAIKDTANLFELRYSFVIIPGRTANYTFYIKALRDIISSDSIDYIFKIDRSDLIAELSKFLTDFTDYRLSFTVSTSNHSKPGKDYQKIITTTFEIGRDKEDQALIHRFYPYNTVENDKGERLILEAGDEIFTSVQFHCPAFSLEK